MSPPLDHVPESSNELASTRTVLAADRTLMAWVRTALSMISFGFTIFKFLHGLQSAGGIHLRRPEEPRNIGLFLTGLGIGSLIAGISEHLTTLGHVEGRRPRLRASFYVACVVLLLGIVVFSGLITQRGPL
jgi:putative membrane protein